MKSPMPTVGVAGALMLLALDVDAQKDLGDLKQAALEKGFLRTAPWVSSFADAKADAVESGKLIFGYFSRSYAP